MSTFKKTKLGFTPKDSGRKFPVTRLDKPFTAISPAQVFEHDGAKFHIIKNKGHVLMRDQFLRGQKSWNAVFQKLIAGEKSLYGTLKKLEVQS
jgi:hypothetical protein